MYFPVLKNKINEMKALENVDRDNYIPIIELISANRNRYDEARKIFNKIKHENRIMVDIPDYLKNDLIEKYDLYDPDKRVDFFIEFSKEYDRDIIPIISFYYTNDLKESYKNNMHCLKKISNEFDEIGIRLFCDNTYKRNDEEFFNNIEIFYDEVFKKTNLIMDVNKNTIKEVSNILESINTKNFKKIILIDEPYMEKGQMIEENNCSLIKNQHLKFVKNKQQKYQNIYYGDYTVVDKKSPYDEEEKNRGPVVFRPYLKYTMVNGDLCKYSAPNFGNMEQYKELCYLITKNPDFNPLHCSTCKDIQKIANGEDLLYSSGGVWKHRMITHHITIMADLLNSQHN